MDEHDISVLKFKVESTRSVIDSISDVFVLDMVLAKCSSKMCELGGAENGTCKGCRYIGSVCAHFCDMIENDFKELCAEISDRAIDEISV